MAKKKNPVYIQMNIIQKLPPSPPNPACATWSSEHVPQDVPQKVISTEIGGDQRNR